MFENRKEAGEQLAQALQHYKSKHPLILAIPRGGVEVGYHVARKLRCDFNVVVSRKLGYPGRPEAAFGALAEDKSLYLNPSIRSILRKETIEEVMGIEQNEIRRRVELYRDGEPLPELKNRTVILVDDGIASGATVMATISLCRKRQAVRLVVAAPVSGVAMYEKLLKQADDVVVLETPRDFYAVSQAYRDFRNLSDESVIRFMDLARSAAENQNKVHL